MGGGRVEISPLPGSDVFTVHNTLMELRADTKTAERRRDGVCV